MNTKKILLEKLKLLQNSFSKRQGWYTGLSIKKYLKNEVFKLKNEFRNPAILAGRWSAYCHYSLILSFTNLLHKNQINENSIVFVHPLLPAPLIDQLASFKCKVVSLDINKNTLAFDQQSLSAYIRQLRASGNSPDLVIHYGFNGIYEPITECVQAVQKMVIPSLVVIENKNVNQALLDLFDTLSLGGVVWNFGDSFFDEHLDQVLDVDLDTQDWFVSWNIETRMRSLLEYHLSKSHDVYEYVLEAYFYILLSDFQKLDWKGWVYKIFATRYILKNKFKDKKEAVEVIKLKYPEIFHAAVPDTVFNLQLDFPEKHPKSNLELTHTAGDLQQKSKEIYTFFTENISNRPPGSLEIPDFYLDKTYLKYFVYTTEPKHWEELLGYMGYNVEKLSEIHPTFWQKPQLVKANFITKFLIIIDLNNIEKY